MNRHCLKKKKAKKGIYEVVKKKKDPKCLLTLNLFKLRSVVTIIMQSFKITSINSTRTRKKNQFSEL